MTQQLWVRTTSGAFIRADYIAQVHADENSPHSTYHLLATTTLTPGTWDGRGLAGGGSDYPNSHPLFTSSDFGVVDDFASEVVKTLVSHAHQAGLVRVDADGVHFHEIKP